MSIEKPNRKNAQPPVLTSGSRRRLQREFGIFLVTAPVLAVCFAVPIARSGDTVPAETFRRQIAAAIEEVQQGEEEGPAIRALMGALPRDPDGNFMVEGDLALTKAELIDHLSTLADGVVMQEDNSELLLATVNGVFSFYTTRAERRLTYAVDKSSFENEARYSEVVALMDEAAGAWEAVCPACAIDFVHLVDLDTARGLVAGTPELNFVVRYRNGASTFLAEAFYPYHTGSDRTVNIYPGLFTSNFPKAGVMTHEVGHILGYRHEQLRGVPGCGAPGSDFVALTDYDNKSIMHYFCGGGGNPEMVLSDTDKQGHRLIYQLASP
jgi:hypothetical protein